MALSVEELLRMAGGPQAIPNTALTQYNRGARPAGRPQQREEAPPRREPPSTPNFEAVLARLAATRPPAPASPPPEESKGGLGSQLKGLGGSIVNGALKPLGYLQKPGNAVAGAVAETLDVVGRPLAQGIEAALAPIGMASRTDWSDPNAGGYDGSFNLGKIGEAWNNEGNVFGEEIVEPAMGEGGTDRPGWVKGVTSFAGAVASDPLTYAAFGSTKAAGKGGRQRYSAKAAERFGPDEAESVIGRLNKSASYLTNAEREILGLEKAGIAVGGMFGNAGVVIPKTAGISNAIGKTLGSTRQQIVKRRPWQAISRDPAEYETAAKVLSGASNAMTKTQAASLIGWHDTFKQNRQTLTNQFGRQFKTALDKSLNDVKYKGMRKEDILKKLTHETESGVVTDIALIQRDILRTATEAGVKINDLGPNYMTHKWADDAWKLINDQDKQLGADLRRALSIDITQGSASSRTRHLKGGKYTIAGKEVNFGNGTIAEINAAMSDAFPDVGVKQWLEDDAAVLVSAYIERISSDIGEVRAFDYLLNSRSGVAGALDDVDSDLIQSIYKKTANPERQRELKKIITGRNADFKVEQAAARATAVDIQSSLVDWLGERAVRYGDVGKRIRVELDAANAGSRSLLAKGKAVVKELSTERKSIEKQIKETDRALKKAQDSLGTATLRMQTERGVNFGELADLGPQPGNVGAAMHDAFRTEIANLTAQRSALQQNLSSIEQFTAEMADATSLSRRLSEGVDDPDFVTDLARQLDAAEMSGRRADLDEALQASQRQADDLVAEEIAAKQQVAEYRDAAKEVTRRGAPAPKVTAVPDDLAPIGGPANAFAEAEAATAKFSSEGAPKAARGSLQADFDRISSVVDQFADDPELAPLVDEMVDWGEQLAKLGSEHDSIKATTGMLAAAKEGDLSEVFEMQLEEGWARIAEKIMVKDVAIQEPLANALQNVRRSLDDNTLWKTVDVMTTFFKAYATATPGFHVRNGMSASFMNITDGVGLKDHVKAISLWKKLHKNPEDFIRTLEANDPDTFRAFEAAFGSGAGGAFGAGELGGDVLGRHKAADNKIQSVLSRASDTRWVQRSRKMGEPVEGVARLAVALNSVARGDTPLDAMSRVSRLHFDYTQVSNLDKVAKRLIPFWTFASRNLPLQMQQMWMRPGAYLTAKKAAEAFDRAHEGEELPDFLQNRDALIAGHLPFNVPGLGSKGDPISFAPDLAHLNLAEDVESFNPANLERVLSNLNPWAIGPAEALNNRNYYFGGEIGGPGARINEAVTSVVTPVAQVQRLGGGLLPEGLREAIGVGDRYKGKNTEKTANWLGLPIRNVK